MSKEPIQVTFTKQLIASKMQSIVIYQGHIHMLRTDIQLLRAELLQLTGIEPMPEPDNTPNEPECILDFIEEVPEEFLTRLIGKEE